MKKLLLISSLFFCFAIANSALAFEQVNSLEATIELNQDASFVVTERITYNFGDTTDRHGIYRDITYKYKARGGNYNLRIDVLSVTNGLDEPEPYEVSTVGDKLRVKVGDANKTVGDIRLYKIKYRVERAINYFDDHDELYWNVTGNEWPVDIFRSQATVVFPEPLVKSEVSTECFAGVTGSQNNCLSIAFRGEDEDSVSEQLVFKSGELAAGQGFTIVVGLPKGIIVKPPFWKSILEVIKDNWVLVWPVIAFFVMFYLWKKHGRDPKGRGTIIAQFDAPKNMTPAQMGVLIDEKADNYDISADIINLAIRGYLKIKKLDGKGILKTTDFELTKLKDESTLSNSYEKKLLTSLFNVGSTVKISSLKERYYKDLAKVKDELMADMVKHGYFAKKPSSVRNTYMVIGGVMLFAAQFASIISPLAAGSVVACSVIVFIFGFFMPARTLKGVYAFEHTRGLKEYIKVAEKDRIKFHNAPEKNPQLFEKLLPFAMVLRLEKAWAEQFKDIYTTAPNWYEDQAGGVFNALYLTRGLGTFEAKAASTLASKPSSSGGSGLGGGGFSGGGFGGGGGGSW